MFVLQSVYNCSDKLAGVTNRVGLPSQRLHDTDLRRAGPHHSTATRRIAPANQRRGAATSESCCVVSTCRGWGHVLEESIPQPGRGEDGLHSARAAPALLHCLAPRQMSTAMQKSGLQRNDDRGPCRIMCSCARPPPAESWRRQKADSSMAFPWPFLVYLSRSTVWVAKWAQGTTRLLAAL